MRLDDAGPRSWLLAGVAGWALAVWLLAVAGMGGRVEPLPDDPSLLKPLPPARTPPPLRLGPLGQYGSIVARPLLSADRKPHPFFLQGEGDAEEQDGFDYVLTSVLITPRLKLAILQPADGGMPARVKLDQTPESHPAWRLVGLSERSAVFEGPEGQRTLELRVYDGVGGERPTQLDAPDDRVPVEPPPSTPTPARVDDAAPAPAADQAQMEAIRNRIEQRRARLRNESKSQPPANSP